MDPLAASAPRNQLLQTFPAEIRSGFALRDQRLDSHMRVNLARERPEWVYFPHRGTVVSLTRSAENGATVEVGIIGSEGLVGIQSVLTMQPSGSDAVVQISGAASRVSLAEVRAAFEKSDVVRDALVGMGMAFLAQVSQHAVCNRLHSVEQRLAKWLLSVRDRMDSDTIGLTHDFLSHMLGIRRSGVTVAVGALTLDGLITHQRNSITVIDRDGLEARTCECYRVVHVA